MSDQNKQDQNVNETPELSDENLEEVSGGCFWPPNEEPPIKLDPPIFYPQPPELL